jgi:uncharacterized protein YegP (UPF0339 family)
LNPGNPGKCTAAEEADVTSKTNPKAKPQLTIEVFRRVTPIRKKEHWGVRIKASNHLTLFVSEKYVNHAHALNAAEIIASGRFTVLDELAAPKEGSA